jgi:hypothetical protein
MLRALRKPRERPEQTTQDGAPTQPNLPYLARESQTLRTANTSSAVLIKCSGRGGRQLGLSPGHVHFGGAVVGATARRAVRLMNLGAGVARVSVERPQPPLRCVCMDVFFLLVMRVE